MCAFIGGWGSWRIKGLLHWCCCFWCCRHLGIHVIRCWRLMGTIVWRLIFQMLASPWNCWKLLIRLLANCKFVSRTSYWSILYVIVGNKARKQVGFMLPDCWLHSWLLCLSLEIHVALAFLGQNRWSESLCWWCGAKLLLRLYKHGSLHVGFQQWHHNKLRARQHMCEGENASETRDLIAPTPFTQPHGNWPLNLVLQLQQTAVAAFPWRAVARVTLGF